MSINTPRSWNFSHLNALSFYLHCVFLICDDVITADMSVITPNHTDAQISEIKQSQTALLTLIWAHPHTVRVAFCVSYLSGWTAAPAGLEPAPWSPQGFYHSDCTGGSSWRPRKGEKFCKIKVKHQTWATKKLLACIQTQRERPGTCQLTVKTTNRLKWHFCWHSKQLKC